MNQHQEFLFVFLPQHVQEIRQGILHPYYYVHMKIKDKDMDELNGLVRLYNVQKEREANARKGARISDFFPGNYIKHNSSAYFCCFI